ncbi:MAG: sugar phosphate isomerase/epimerase family protein [Endomicrobiia bacterium]|nr:sugar phosphate isomerase/epimerase family protein [Endomicrobiia bacterium]
MKIGRDFTNLLNTSFLTPDERNDLKSGKLAVSDMDARVQIRAKADIVNQIKVAKETGLNHVELDGGVPNPYLELSEGKLVEAKEYAAKNAITLSFHLPYTFVAAATASFQESDRAVAVELLKKYIDVAKILGCNNVNMHPGAVPFYQAVGEYKKIVKSSVTKSLEELVPYAESKGLVFHLENNTAFDSICFEVAECLEIIDAVNKKGGKVKFCFDIGHWFTRADTGLKISEPPEDIMNEIPKGYLGQIHLNDYIPVVKKFHPPLHYEHGLLKKANLMRLVKMLKDKGADLIVVETAVREIDELLDARAIMDAESKFLRDVLKEAGV